MINKSKVRQTALNLIYAIEETGGNQQDLNLDLFWRITQEKETDHYRQALAKAIGHVCRASGDTARLLETRSDTALETLHGDLTASKLSTDLDRLRKRSAEFESALHAMLYCTRDKRQDTTDQLELCCKDVLNLAGAIEGLGRDVQPLFNDFPAYRSVLEPLAAAIRRRCKLMTICAALSTPLAMEGNNEFAGLVRAARNLQELRPVAEKYALEIIDKKVALDTRLEELLKNYSTTRLDVIDRCILYIALYELEEKRLDTPIVVSEATSLADTYSGSKSAPFIHGIISAAAKARA